MSISSTKVRPSKVRTGRQSPTKETPKALQEGRLGVPWAAVLPLAVVLAYADGYWLTSLRGAVGAIERTQDPFASWLRESTLFLPVFVFAVLGALTLALRRFGPVLRNARTILATGLMVAAAGTVVGILEMAASAAYDYHLQSTQLQLMHSLGHTSAAKTLAQQSSLGLQLRAMGYGSALILVTNLVLVGWVVAMLGGRLNMSTTRRRTARALPVIAADRTHPSRVDDLRLLLAAGLLGSAALHAAVVPARLTGWAALLDPTSAAVFFIALAAAQLAVAALVLTRPQPTVLHAAAVISVGPLALYLYSRTAGIEFGPGARFPEQVALTSWAACALEVSTLIVAIFLVRGTQRLRRRPPASTHVRWLTLVAVIAVTAIGLAGSGLPVLDDFGSSLHGAELGQVATHPGHVLGR